MLCGDKVGSVPSTTSWFTSRANFCHGLPIRPSFSAPKQFSKQDIRARLGLHEDAPTVMLVGGGEGMGKLKEIAEALGQTYVSSQLMPLIAREARGCSFFAHV